MGVTDKGIRYPDSSAHKRIWEHWKNQSDDVNLNLGLFVCTSSTRPGSPWQGQQIFETDTKAHGFWDGNAWVMTDTVVQTYTPALTASTTNPTMGSSPTLVGRYQRHGGMMHAWGRIAFGTGMTAGSGVYNVSIPAAAEGSVSELVEGSGILYDSSANDRNVMVPYGSGSTFLMMSEGNLVVVTNAVPWVWAAADVILWNVHYAVA